MQNIKRYTLVDVLRGLAIIAMVAYHTLWDLVYIFDVGIPWFTSDSASFFQMSIRWSFIFISGFSLSFSRNKLKRGITVLIGSVIISLATYFFMPENFILFGVLNLIAVGMLATIPLEKLFKKIHPLVGIILCFLLFYLTYSTELGRWEIGNFTLLKFPKWLYLNNFTAFFSFPPKSFDSPDYVPLLPWLFLFWVGYFTYLLCLKKGWLKYLSTVSFKPLEFLGRHSLLIYLLHQPIIYVILKLIFI